MINSRKLEDLDESTEKLARKLKEECNKQGIDFLITSTFRDKEEQDRLFKQVPKVTQVRGGSSQHQYRNAFDVCPYKKGTKVLDWNDIAAFKKIGEIGMSIGLEWGGSWKGFVDMPHFQNMQGMKLKDFQKKYPSGEAPPRRPDLQHKIILVETIHKDVVKVQPTSTFGEDKPKQKAQIKFDPIPEPEKPSLIGFAKHLFNKFTGKN